MQHDDMTTMQEKNKGVYVLLLGCYSVEVKMHDSPHPSKTIISYKRILELLHVDLFGPTTHASLGAKKHCLVIVDDYSRYMIRLQCIYNF